MKEQRSHSESATRHEREAIADSCALEVPFAATQDVPGEGRLDECLREISLSSPAGIYIVQDERLRFISPQFQRDSGRRADDLLGTDFLSLVFPEDRDVVRQNASAMLDGTRPQPYEYRLVAEDGTTRWVLAAVTPIRYRGRQAALGCYMDITGRKEKEERLTDDRVQLERIIQELAAKLQAAEERANTDELTGLFNHRCFYDRLNEEIARCSRFSGVFSLVLADVDHFKHYNDTEGHLAGDGLLRQLGQIMGQTGRIIDIGFRYAGDEFAVLLPGTPLDGGFVLAERIRKRVEVETNDGAASQTCSFGIASWPIDGATREEIIQAADAALYHAKQNGRNRVCLAQR